MLRAFLCLLALLLASPLSASGPTARKQAESSLHVTGTIVIDTDGKVQSHEIDPRIHLTPELSAFVSQSLARWRFQPVKVDGRVVRARVPMSLRLVATRLDDDKFYLRIASTYFGGSHPATDSVRFLKMSSPKYPDAAARAGGKGMVYLLLQIGRDGKVMNVGVEQVNLRVVGPAVQMDALRKLFGEEAARAARRWTFQPPTTGEYAGRDTWFARVPVNFFLSGDKMPQPGEWETYIPGPRNTDMPWAHDQLKTAGAPDALPDHGVFPLEQGAKLLAPPAT